MQTLSEYEHFRDLSIDTLVYLWIYLYGMVFIGCGFTSGGEESGCVFFAVVCKIQARKHYIESLPPVPKDKRGCFSQSERPAVHAAASYHVFALLK